jgi:hypothetical protein
VAEDVFGRIIADAISGLLTNALSAMFTVRPDPSTIDAARLKAHGHGAVKLLHSAQLNDIERFPRYQDHQGISYGAYLAGHEKLRSLRQEHKSALDTVERLADLDVDTLEDYQSVTVKVPRSPWRRTMRLPLPNPQHRDTVIEAQSGAVEDGALVIKSGWFERIVYVRFLAPKRNVHGPTIADLRSQLDALDDVTQRALAEIEESPFNDPVLFISHRWQSPDHPDPAGEQLRKLRTLRHCFLIYDYASFPQPPLLPEQAEDLALILSGMDDLIHKVIVLRSDDYVDRGWCLYEYLAGSLRGTIICDELRDPRFLKLANWAVSKPPPPFNPFHDGYEAHLDNFIQESLLGSINEILPTFKASRFSIETDRKTVRALLITLLKNRLPNKRTHDPYLGESQGVKWTNEELASAFDEPLRWEKLQTIGADPARLGIPHTLEDAAMQAYEVEIKNPSGWDLLIASPFGAFRRERERMRDSERNSKISRQRRRWDIPAKLTYLLDRELHNNGG